MKLSKIIIMSWLLWNIIANSPHLIAQCVSNNSNAPCCNNDTLSGKGFTRTNPTDAFNPETSLGKWKNKFDWRKDTIRIYQRPTWGIQTPATPFYQLNPFYMENNLALEHISFFGFRTYELKSRDSLDFHPRDGWELIHRHFGYQPDEVSSAPLIDNRRSPYMILYNRYTGTLRFITALNGILNNSDKIVTSLQFFGPSQPLKMFPLY